MTDAGLQDAGVATGTVSNLLRDFAEELVDGLFAVEVAEDNTAVVGGVLFGAIDEGLDIYSYTRSALALASVVSILFSRMREVAMLESIATRCAWVLDR